MRKKSTRTAMVVDAAAWADRQLVALYRETQTLPPITRKQVAIRQFIELLERA